MEKMRVSVDLKFNCERPKLFSIQKRDEISLPFNLINLKNKLSIYDGHCLIAILILLECNARVLGQRLNITYILHFKTLQGKNISRRIFFYTQK